MPKTENRPGISVFLLGMSSSSALLWSCGPRVPATPTQQPWQPRLIAPLATHCRRQVVSSWGSPRAPAECLHSSLRISPGVSTAWRIAAEGGDGPEGEQHQEQTPSDGSTSEDNAVVKAIEAQLAKSFGGPLWFGVLAVTLGIAAGGYVYLIYNYADFADIPILRGPQGL